MSIKNMFKGIFNYIKKTDWLLWLLIIAISLYCLALLNSVSVQTDASWDSSQLMAILLGLAGAVIISMLDYAGIASFWYLIAGFSIFLMIYTLIVAEAVVGSGGVNARAWIIIFGRTFQSSELVKIGFIITLSKHLDVLRKKGLLDDILQLILLLFHAMVPALLCHQQGDDGAGVVFIFMFLCMCFAAGIKLRYFMILAGVVLLLLPVLWNFVLEDYQKLRFTAVYNLDDANVINNEGYQQYNARISIGSGQFFGHGLYQGRRVSSKMVSFQNSDFIFSVAGEELGFIGCMAILLLLLFLLLKILHIARNSRDDLGKYMCFGYFGLIAIQSIANIGMCLAVLPVMGVTLPFFSSGGSSAMCLYFGIGLLQSVYSRKAESDGMRLNRNSPIRLSYKK